MEKLNYYGINLYIKRKEWSFYVNVCELWFLIRQKKILLYFWKETPLSLLDLLTFQSFNT